MTSVSDPIKLTVNIPEELQKTDRTFYLLSCYNGEATVVAQGTGSKLTWNADKFSTYLIAYKDPVDSNKDTNKDSSKGFTATWKKRKKQTTGYQIRYARNSKFSSGKKTVTIKKKKTGSKKITGLKAKKKYYVKIRTYKKVGGKKYYSYPFML